LTVAGATSVMTTAEEECGGGMEDSTSTREDKSGLTSLGMESKLSGKILSSSKEKPGHSVSSPLTLSTGCLFFLATGLRNQTVLKTRKISMLNRPAWWRGVLKVELVVFS